MGYTPSLATGVWVGNSNNDEMRRGADGSIVAAPIWQEYMKMATRGPVEAFHTPPPNSADKPILQGKIGADVITKIDKYTGLIIPDSCLTTYPPEFIEEKKFGEVHNILYYINKDNPGGPPPSDPTSDPQYNNWEEPVKRWAQQNNYVEKRPAIGDCSIRADENKPVISITVPVNGATVSNVNIIIQSAVTAPRPIKKVVYFLDDKEIGKSQIAPFILAYDSTGLENGFHDLKAEAYDDIDNKSSTSITINYLVSPGSVIPPE
jgi:membrane carboxypeptidase/penicillin-binding protein PbpC